MIPVCNECGGKHEPSGARSDCITYWKLAATKRHDLVEWACALLCNATPNPKFLDEMQQGEWARNFGKWFAEMNGIDIIMDEYGVDRFISKWLRDGTYRVIMHRHTGTYRAVDESERKYMEADTLPLLADALLNWQTDAEPFSTTPQPIS